MIERQPNTQYVLALSYGKDSIAALEAIRILGYPLDRIVHAEIWATDTISADLPPMVEFKAYADKIIKERYGIEVEHICAMKDGEKLTYEKMFYHKPVRRAKREREILGFPQIRGVWCNSGLKLSAVQRISTYPRKLVQEAQNRTSRLEVSTDFRCQHLGGGLGVPNSKRAFSKKPQPQGADINTVEYLGIASDEPVRIERHKDKKVLPLVDIGWTEADCRKWCEENDLLSPIYTTSTRGGCWFCHNQSIEQLRLLRKNYPELWSLMLKWDLDSPVTFHADGHTVHDFEKRFAAEDRGVITPGDRRFRWKQVLQDGDVL